MGDDSAALTGTCVDCGKATAEPMTCSDGSVFCFDCYDKRWPLDLPGHLVHAVHRVDKK